MNKAIPILALLLAVIIAAGADSTYREGYFWRLESEGSNSSSWNNPGPNDDEWESIEYYYNANIPSQLDSARVESHHSQAGESNLLKIYTRTDHTDYYEIEETIYWYFYGHQSFQGSSRKRYNWQDQLLLDQNYDSSQNLVDHWEYAYDSMGNTVSEKCFTWQGPVSTLETEILRAYNDDELMTWLRLRDRYWLTGEMSVLREETHYYGVHVDPDSSEVYLHTHNASSSIQSLIDWQYNLFDQHGNLVHRLDKIFPNPGRGGLKEALIKNTYTQYIPGPQGWLAAEELSHGIFMNNGWTISCYADSTLATYSYSSDFLQETYVCQSFTTLWETSRTTEYNDAGLKTSQSIYTDQGSNGGSYNGHWDWAYVSSQGDDPDITPEAPSLFCAPNPFRESLGLKLIADEGPFAIRVYNIRGQLVRILAEGNKNPTEYFTSWDGHDEAGVRLTAGVYVIRAETASGNISSRVSLVH